MKRIVLGMTALMCAMSMQSKEPLALPGGIYTCLEEDACGLHQLVEGRAEGRELRTGYPLPALADSQHHDDLRCW